MRSDLKLFCRIISSFSKYRNFFENNIFILFLLQHAMAKKVIPKQIISNTRIGTFLKTIRYINTHKRLYGASIAQHWSIIAERYAS